MSETVAKASGDAVPAPSDASREVDLLLAELDLVLSCRCCAPREGFFAAEGWSETESRSDNVFSRDISSDVACWGELR